MNGIHVHLRSLLTKIMFTLSVTKVCLRSKKSRPFLMKHRKANF